jgi:hypothetical protein
LPSRPAAKLVERGLSWRSEWTLAGLTRLMGIVRITRLLHRGDWELNLASTDLRSLTLDGTTFRLFEGASFAGARLDNVRLLGLLARADFDYTKIHRSSFIGCALEESSLRGAMIEDVVVLSSQASGCTFMGAQLISCTFSDVTMNGSSLNGATLRDTVFEQCDLADVVAGDSTWENVDLVDCRNVSEELAALAHVTVIVGGRGGKGVITPARTTLGATPRSLWTDARGDAPERVTVRYAGASTRSRPPLGYRIETLARLLSVWIALGSDYWEARRNWRRADTPMLTDIFPRSRPLFALKVLAGSVQPQDHEHIAAFAYELLVEAFERRYPDLGGIALPELIFVDGNRPVVKYVDLGERAYIVMSIGMEVMTIRLARHCVAWTCPEAVSYMDDPPTHTKPDAIRDVLRRDLEWFARSGDGDIAGVGRIQVSGLRHTHASIVTMTFLAFTLAHEMAHFLHSRGFVDLDGGAWGGELEADILAAKVLMEEEELDGDTMLIEDVKKVDVAEIRRVLRRTQREMTGDSVDQIDIDEIPDEALKQFAEELAPQVSRFAECNWHAAAIAALILIVGGSIGYDSEDDPVQRMTMVIRAAFGEDVLASVEKEMATKGSVLHLLNDVFSRPDSRE